MKLLYFEMKNLFENLRCYKIILKSVSKGIKVADFGRERVCGHDGNPDFGLRSVEPAKVFVGDFGWCVLGLA